MSDEQVYEAEEANDGGMISVSALEAITRGEIDIAIATAKRYPRNLAKFKASAIAAVTSSQEIAEGCSYYLERTDRKTNEKKAIEGPSIRLMEILVPFYTNTRWAGRVIGADQENVYAQGIFFDLENNNVVQEEVARRITTSKGSRYGADMIGVTGAAAKSIAMRNAAKRVIPLAITEEVRQKAKLFAQGDARSAAERFGKAAKFFASIGVTEAQLLAKLEIDTVEKITPEHIGRLNGIRTALRDSMTTIAEQFPSAAPQEPTDETKLQDAPAPSGDKNTEKVADDLAKKKEAKPRAKKDKPEKDQATPPQQGTPRGDLIAQLHEKLTSIFGGDEKIVDAALAEASKDTFPTWSTFAQRATIEQVQEVLNVITSYKGKPAETAATATAATATEARQQTLTPPPAADGQWIARLTQKLPEDPDRSTWVLRVLKGAEIVGITEAAMIKELSAAIDMKVTSADTIVGLNVEALKAVHKRLQNLV